MQNAAYSSTASSDEKRERTDRRNAEIEREIEAIRRRLEQLPRARNL